MTLAPSTGEGDRAGSRVWAVVPVKPFALGKSRLALEPDDRDATNRAFLRHVLTVLRQVVPAERIVVVSSDDAALETASNMGGAGLPERSGGNLNDALAQGAASAHGRGAAAVLSIFADLAFLEPADVRAMLAAYRPGTVVIAPDAQGLGTNAMLMAPLALPYRHGAGSLRRHLDAARDADLPVALVRRPGLMRDIDLPDDYEALLVARRGGGGSPGGRIS